MDKDLVLMLRLRLDQVNLILLKLGQCPYAEVAELIATLKGQGDAGIEAARYQGYQAQNQAEAPGNGLAQTLD